VLCDLVEPITIAAELRARGTSVLTFAADVTDAAAVENVAQNTVTSFGTIDILVNNAAMMGDTAKPVSDISTAEWDRVMAVNARGPFECIKAVLPAMRRQHSGKIVNISSSMVFNGTPFLLHYAASKGAVIALTRSLARELGDDNISVNCISPGLIPTTEGAAAVVRGEEHRRRVIEGSCFKREQTPDDLIGALLFLVSSDSAFVTGQTLVVDGGLTMH
jgi:NAD(P)-dependent dehydrogenase (short-subunit alcohol dehydrogenase family)